MNDVCEPGLADNMRKVLTWTSYAAGVDIVLRTCSSLKRPSHRLCVPICERL